MKMKTIREQIISTLKTELEKLRITNGYYTDVGQRVIRGRYDISADEIPAIVLLPGTESAEREGFHTTISLPVSLEAFIYFGTHNAGIEGNKVLGDLLVNMTGVRLALAFSNGSRQPAPGQTISGASSSATGVLESITVSSGAWATGDAAGTFSIRLPYGEFTSETLKNEGNETIAQTPGTITLIPRLANLVNDIEYQSGGVEIFPDPGENIVKTTAEFIIHYVTLTGNPYKQT